MCLQELQTYPERDGEIDSAQSPERKPPIDEKRSGYIVIKYTTKETELENGE